MAIKQLDKNENNTVILRLFFIAFLIVAAVVYGKFRLNKIPPKDQILGKITQNKESKEKNTFSLEGIQLQTKKVLDETALKTEETLGEVLGQAKTFAVQTASKSANSISDFVFDNTVGNLLNQIEKLPKEQQEDIKRNVCK